MNAKHLESTNTSRHSFVVELDDMGEKKTYSVVIYTNNKGKFIDESISHFNTDQELEGEGTEGDIREQIIDYLDENWDSLVK